ncbi:tetratricopeptide repeat protein [Pendulispora brunnea]|uniref:Tetratricopeptide repeat protein n=1 Tax=Pendulispora brunnea TaxID=2905690 RepID=A0ABZ2JU15_9BACT
MKWLFITWLALVVSSPAVVRAEDTVTTEARARQYYTEGTEHFQSGRYLEAGAAFTAGYELSHKPGFLWNMAECARLGGQGERALDLYRRYVKEAPEGRQRTDAEKHIRELEPPAPAPKPVAIEVKPHRERDVFRPLPGDKKPDSPITHRWWFWTGAAAVVAGAIVTGVVIATSGGKDASGPSGATVDWRTR